MLAVVTCDAYQRSSLWADDVPEAIRALGITYRLPKVGTALASTIVLLAIAHT